MKPFVLGVAGGTGSGKSTLAFGLQDAYPGKVLILHVDDYFKPEKLVPTFHGTKNWDDPRAIYSQKLIGDLQSLKAGRAVDVMTKSPRLNPKFKKTFQRISVEHTPAPLIVVEGFLALYFKDLRPLIDQSIYLDAPFETHIKRRVHGIVHDFPEHYIVEVLKPMHEQYVLPCKNIADIVIDTSELDQRLLLEKVKRIVEPYVTTDYNSEFC